MSAGAEWDRAGLAARKQMIREAWPFLGKAFVADQVTKAWQALDVDLQRKLHRAWNEKLEALTPPEVTGAGKLDIEAVLEAVRRDDNTGFCIECHAEQGGCEPDARRYKCESCGAMAVYGAAEVMIMTCP